MPKQRGKFVTFSEASVYTLQHELQLQRSKMEAINRELAISEERARQAIEASNAAIWDYDLTTGEVYLSEAWASFLGGKRKPTYTTIQALTDLVPADERQMVKDAMVRVIKRKRTSEYRLNHRIKKPDGDFIWVHSRGKVIERDRYGRALRMIGMKYDITNRMLAEAKLVENEQRFRVLFESAGDYALVLELRGEGDPIIVDGNKAFFKKHGYSRKELIGQPVSLIETPESGEQITSRKELIKNGTVVHFEVEHRCKDGSTFNAEAVVKMVQYLDDGPVYVYSVERDITEIRQAEANQKRLLVENRRLLQKLFQVQENERRSLVRDLHDDLGQLLTSIGTRAEYIAKHALDTDVRNMAAEIVRDTQASFAASRATLSRLRPAALDTLGLTAALTELTDKTKNKMNMNCSLSIEGKIDKVDDLYAITIFRLVQEALTNAQRHGKADHAEVVVKYVRGRQIQVVISDDGKGVNETKMSEGLGILGMRERVHAAGGTFRLTHVPQDGVRIEAVLPLQEARSGK